MQVITSNGIYFFGKAKNLQLFLNTLSANNIVKINDIINKSLQ